MKRIYVSNLSLNAGKTSVTELFTQYGKVNSVNLYNSPLNTGKKFGFVEMADNFCAKNAIKKLNGKEFMGNKLIVNLASNQQPSTVMVIKPTNQRLIKPVVSTNTTPVLPKKKNDQKTTSNGEEFSGNKLIVNLASNQPPTTTIPVQPTCLPIIKPEVPKNITPVLPKKKERTLITREEATPYIGKRVTGKVVKVSAGLALVQCKELKDEIAIHNTECHIGELIERAKVTFTVDYDENRGLLKGVNAESNRIYTPPASGSAYALPDFSGELTPTDKTKLHDAFANGLPAVIWRTKKIQFSIPGDQSQRIKDMLRDACGAQNSQIYTLSELAKELKLDKKFSWPELHDCLSFSYAAIARLDNSSVEKLQRTFYELFGEHILETDLNAWKVLIDETGSCNDYAIENTNSPSVIMALIIPPGVVLPAVTFDFHGVRAYFKPEINTLRENILDLDEISIIALQYESGAPPEGLSGKHLFTDFHTCLWRHIIHIAMEHIAVRESNGAKSREVKFYLENVGKLDISRSNVYDSDIASLMERLKPCREGWQSLVAAPVKIVPKNIHPLLGYVDALGFIFRVSPGTENPYSTEILSRRNTFFSLYKQEALQEFEEILFSSGARPLASLLGIGNLHSNNITDYRQFLKALTVSCLNRLNSRDRRELVDTLTKNLSRFPDRYTAADFIIKLFPADWIESIADPEMKAIAMLNQLVTANHRGDAESDYIKTVVHGLQKIMPEVKNRDTKFRYYSILADHYSNMLGTELSIEFLHEHAIEAKACIETSQTAVHVLGQRAVLLAINGDSQQAMASFKEIFDFQADPADKERHLIYQTHAAIDLGNMVDAASLARSAAHSGNWNNIAEACRFSQYLLHAVLKLQAYSPWLNDKELNAILEIRPGKDGFPWCNIAYWRIHALKSGGNDRLQKIWYNALVENLAPEQVSCPALRLICGCIADQCRRENIVLPPSLDMVSIDNYAKDDPLVKMWMQSHPLFPEKTRGMLAPLFFNFK